MTMHHLLSIKESLRKTIRVKFDTLNKFLVDNIKILNYLFAENLQQGLMQQ